MDVQGAEAARPYVEKANAEYVTLVDRENVLGNRIGFKAIPNTFLIDEAGRFQGKVSGEEEAAAWIQGTPAATSAEDVPVPAASSNGAGRIKALETLVEWLPTDVPVRLQLAELYREASEPKKAEIAYRQALRLDDGSATAHFRYAALLLASDRTAEALDHLRAAQALDPENWVIRKQIWAIEHPDRFYEGGIDWDWQREQIKREDASR